MKKVVIENAVVIKRDRLNGDCRSLTIGNFPKSRLLKPGQFVHIRIPGPDVYFRRAFSVYDINPRAKSLQVIFKIVGRGTALLAELRKGDRLNVMGPLGKGFDFPFLRDKVILIAGGIGMPPIYFLAKKLIESKYDRRKILFFYGGKTKKELVNMAHIRKLGIKLYPTTDNGSYGFRGFVTKAVREFLNRETGQFRIYACGPQAMLRAVEEIAREYSIPGQISVEAPMPCGMGICQGCVLPLVSGGYTRVCRDGPVYQFGEVLL